jgi:hypothetical protein
MQIVIKEDKVFAIHTNDQDLDGHYDGLEVLEIDGVKPYKEDGNPKTKAELVAESVGMPKRATKLQQLAKMVINLKARVDVLEGN